MSTFTAYTETGSIAVPDVKLVGPLPLRGIYEFIPLRGYGSVVAVRSRVNGTLIGWICADEADPSIPKDGRGAKALMAKVRD